MKTPLLLALALLVLWIGRHTGLRWRTALGIQAGLCLGWGLSLHILDDVVQAQVVRLGNLRSTAAFERVLPEHSVLVAYWGLKDPVAPLLLERDILVLNPQPDEGRDTAQLIGELSDRGRRIFVLENGFPPDVLQRVLTGSATASISHLDRKFLELRR
jgi:hypothetical protein